MRDNLPAITICPSQKYFSHWRSDDGLIDAFDTAIYLNLEQSEHGGMVVKGVTTSFFPVRRMRELKYKGHPLFDEQKAAYRGYSHSGAGSHFDADGEWMKNGNVMPPPELVDETGSCLGFSPDGDFAWLRYFGFENEDYARQALEQFAFIRECIWARDGSIDPKTLVMTAAVRKRRAEIDGIKSWIYAEEQERCLREFEQEVKRRLENGEMKCPKNVDIYFDSMRLKAETAETNLQYLRLKEQWNALHEKLIRERDLRIEKRDCNSVEEIQAYHASQIKEEIKSCEYKQKKKIFYEIANRKILSGEWVVPEGVSIYGTGLMISGGAVHWDENVPVNVLHRQLDELKTQVFGE